MIDISPINAQFGTTFHFTVTNNKDEKKIKKRLFIWVFFFSDKLDFFVK